MIWMIENGMTSASDHHRSLASPNSRQVLAFAPPKSHGMWELKTTLHVKDFIIWFSLNLSTIVGLLSCSVDYAELPTFAVVNPFAIQKTKQEAPGYELNFSTVTAAAVSLISEAV